MELNRDRAGKAGQVTLPEAECSWMEGRRDDKVSGGDHEECKVMGMQYSPVQTSVDESWSGVDST